MIKIEKTEVVGWEAAIRGMRNPKNSWDRSDSGYGCEESRCNSCEVDLFYDRYSDEWQNYVVGPNDLDLMMRLAKGGPVHAKYRRMIIVYVTITAPLYWWKEFDTYKVGTVANSCSTMHKIHAKEFTLKDFSCEHLINDRDFCWDNGLMAGPECMDTPLNILDIIIDALNIYREKYLETKDKKYWWQMIQLFPSSYNQKRTVMLNYEVLAGIYPMRKNHKLDEWREFCDWIETLPYSEIITGKNESEEILKIGEALHKGMEKGLVDAWKKANPGAFVDEWPVSQEEVDELAKGWNELVDKARKEAFPNDLEDDSSDTHDIHNLRFRLLKKKLDDENG